jgi:hypothetical protein
MAKLGPNGLSGSIGKVTYKQTKGGITAGTKVEKVKQTKETKKLSSVFGAVSHFCGNLRYAMSNISDHTDADMVTRVTKEVGSIFRHAYDKKTESYYFETNDFNRLTGLDLNINSPFKNSLWIPPTVELASDNILSVKLPALRIPHHLNFLKDATECQIKIEVFVISLADGYIRDAQFKILEIQATQKTLPAQEWLFEVAEGCVCVVGIGLNYYSITGRYLEKLNSLEHNPAQIVGAVLTPGTFVLPVNPEKHRIKLKWHYSAASVKIGVVE